MSDNLKIYEPAVKAFPAIVSFNNFEALKTQALAISDRVSSIVVTEDSIKENKKLVAMLRKSTKDLDAKRLEVKRAILKDYDFFESQIKDLKNIVDNADQVVRAQVRAFEDKEKGEKEMQLREIFSKRFPMYDLDPILNEEAAWMKWFDSNRSVLNKTTSTKAAEESMVDWLEKAQKDIETIRTMPDVHDILIEYSKNLDLAQSIQDVQDRKNREKVVEKAINENAQDEEIWRSVMVFGDTQTLEKAKGILEMAGFKIR